MDAMTNWLRITSPISGTISELDSKTRKLDCAEYSYFCLVDANVRIANTAKNIAVIIEKEYHTADSITQKFIRCCHFLALFRGRVGQDPYWRTGKQEVKVQKQGKTSQNPCCERPKVLKIAIFNSKKGVLAYEPLPKVPFSA